MKTESGCHTFSLTCKSSYTEIQNIAGQNICISRSDKYHLNINHEIFVYKPVGVEIHMYQSLTHPSWIKLIVNPSSLLAGEYCSTALFDEPKDVSAVKKQLRKILDECGIDQRLKQFKLSRFDLTRNQYYSSEEELHQRLDRFKKSYVMPRYETETDRYSWTINCKSSEFSVYNKTYELKKRHNIEIEDQILRLELRMGRKRVLQVTKKSDWEGQLAELCGKADSYLDSFLHRLYQDCGEPVSLNTALGKIEESSFQSKVRERLRRLVKLAANTDSLCDVRKSMKLSRKAFGRLLDRFYKLEISPIVR